MKHSLSVLAICSTLTLSCRAAEKPSKNRDAVSCPAEIGKGFHVPNGAILLGELSDTKKKLRTVGLVKKSTSRIEERIWDEEMVEWEDSPEGSSAETKFDSSQTDWLLKCSYPGHIDQKKKEYFDISLLLPIPERVPVSCRFLKTKGTTSATCKSN